MVLVHAFHLFVSRSSTGDACLFHPELRASDLKPTTNSSRTRSVTLDQRMAKGCQGSSSNPGGATLWLSRCRAPKEGEIKGDRRNHHKTSRSARFTHISCGYDGEDRMAGLIVLLPQEALQLNQHREVPPSPASACGKMGSLATLDVIVEGCCAYIEGDDRGPKLWDRVLTVLATVRARTTVVLASGHVESGEGPNGALHSAQSTNTNGERLVGACTTQNLTLVNTWKSQRRGADGVGWGSARESQVKGCEKAETWTNQTIASPHRGAQVQSGSKQITRWHYALKHAVDNPEATCNSRTIFQQWVDAEGAKHQTEMGGAGC